jgi:hypothetical protein
MTKFRWNKIFWTSPKKVIFRWNFTEIFFLASQCLTNLPAHSSQATEKVLLHDGQAEETLLVGWKPRAAGGKCKVNWQRVCRPKQFGITDLERFGRALRLRWLWGQWKHPDKPWCNSEIPVDDIDQALFAAATKVTIHNGYTAKFWTTHWAHGNSLVSMFPALFSHSRKKNRTIA